MTDRAEAFPETGRQIFVAYGTQWDSIVKLFSRVGWALFEIPLDLTAPDSDGIPTYAIQPKGNADGED